MGGDKCFIRKNANYLCNKYFIINFATDRVYRTQIISTIVDQLSVGCILKMVYRTQIVSTIVDVRRRTCDEPRL